MTNEEEVIEVVRRNNDTKSDGKSISLSVYKVIRGEGGRYWDDDIVEHVYISKDYLGVDLNVRIHDFKYISEFMQICRVLTEKGHSEAMKIVGKLGYVK